MSKKPLEGIRVLDFTNALAGPYCSMMLGNMGAEVIKVEKPGTGDDSRGYGPFVNGQSGYFVSVNHGKKSVVCNTKDPEGVEMFKDLVKHVDIVVENLKAGAMNRMGLGYEELKKVNPKLIYVAISGFGQTGPSCPPPRLRYGSAGHGRRNEHHRRARRKACPRRRFYRRYHCRYLWCFWRRYRPV